MPDDGFGLDHLPYGVYSVGAGAPRVGVRLGDAVLDVATVAARARPPDPQRLHGPRAGGLGRDPRRDRRARRGRRPAGDPARRRAGCTCRSRSATTSTSTPRSTTPPTSGGSSGPTRSRCCPTGATSRSATTGAPAPSSSAVRRSSGRAGSGSRRARLPGTASPTEYGPSRRLDIEAELGFVVGAGSERGSRIARRRARRPRLRRRRPQRLVGARHPGLGVRAARPVPRQVVRHVGQRLGDAPRGARRGLVRPAGPGPDAAALPGLDRLDRRDARPTRLTDGGSTRLDSRRGGAQRRGREPPAVPHDVLVARPDAGPPDRQRCLARGPATCSPPGTISGPEPDTRGSFLELSWGGQEPFGDGRTFLEDGDEVVLRYSAPGTGGGRITLGEVVGRIEPARP